MLTREFNLDTELVNFATVAYSKFDDSHNMDHIRRVFAFADRIVDAKAITMPMRYRNVMIHTIALHDAVDHKYSDCITIEELTHFLQSRLPENDVGLVLHMIDNISWSKENQGKCVAPTEMNDVMQIIQDADRLDAIGENGLRRCEIYSRSKSPNATEAEIAKKVVDHIHEKLLLVCKGMHNAEATQIVIEDNLEKALHDFITDCEIFAIRD